MSSGSPAAAATAVRRVVPVVPPLDAEAIPAGARREALEALADLTEAAAYLGDPDMFHRPRFRTMVHRRHIGSADPLQLTERIATAAEDRASAGLLAVHSVRAEIRERPDRRPCFAPESLAELHRLIAAADPNIPGRGGFRRSAATVTWTDGRRFAIDVPPGRALRGHVERWFRWGTRTTSPPLDAAAFSMVRLVTIHPFPDANGRIARLLAQCDLVAAGLMPGLLLDLEGWVHGHRYEHDEAVVAASEGRWTQWGALFARAVTETAHHRIAAIGTHRRLLDSAIERVEDDPVAVAVLTHFRSSSAVSAQWLRDRMSHDPEPTLARLLEAGILTAHPRLPGALVHPELLAVLDAPFG
ncbi:Fic family protein [Streptomyces sp. NBC_01537]|uniref:Fic family protein n=1 Tax=Streptomyces sp. NBC_01537 TaxID=2903896 RepID=UPI00386EF48A